jgi:hypothetical protein
VYVNPPQELQIAHAKTLATVQAADLLSNTLLLTGLGVGTIAVVWFRGADIQGLLLIMATLNCGLARMIQHSEQGARETLKAQRAALGEIKSMNASADVEAQLTPQPVRQVVDKSAVLLRELSAMLPTAADQGFVAHISRKFGNELAAQIAKEILVACMMAPPSVIPPADCPQALKKALLCLLVKQYTGVSAGWDLLAYDQQAVLRGMPMFVGVCPQPAAATAAPSGDDLGFSNWKL